MDSSGMKRSNFRHGRVMPGSLDRRGAFLLEVMLALVLFVTMGAVILGVLRNVTATEVRLRDRQVAIDLAASKMAQLEAGLTTVDQLNNSTVDIQAVSDQSGDHFNQDEALTPGRWRIEVESERSRFSRYSVITIHIYDTHAPSNTGTGGIAGAADSGMAAPTSLMGGSAAPGAPAAGPAAPGEGVEVYELRQLVLLKDVGGIMEQQDFGTDSDLESDQGF